MYRMIIVDDEKAIRTGLMQVIDWADYDIEICGAFDNGGDAFDYISENEVDIVISDIKMPGTDGLELLKLADAAGFKGYFIILSGYDDFAFVKEALKYDVENYLLKPVNHEELKQTVEDILNKYEDKKKANHILLTGTDLLRSNIFNRLLKNRMSTSEFNEKAELLNLTLAGEQMQVAILNDCAAMAHEEGVGWDRINDLNKLCIQKCSENDLYTFVDHDGFVVMIFIYGKGFRTERDIFRFLERLRDQALSELGLESFITVGTVSFGIKELSDSYEHALDAQLYGTFGLEDAVVMYQEIVSKRQNVNDQLNLDFEFIENNLRASNLDALEGYLNRLFEQVVSLKGVKPELIYDLCVELEVCIRRELKSNDVDENGSFETETRMIHQLIRRSGIIEMKTYLLKLIVYAVGALEKKKTSKSQMIIDEIVEYIETHYNHELSLKTLSQQLFFNADYLGRQFSKEMKMTFSDYVNHVRIGKAKMLLENSNIKTSMIAEEAGFRSTNYFYSVFKKYVGVTPTEYRNGNHTNYLT